MSAFGSLAGRVFGAVAPSLQRAVAKDIDQLIETLLDIAIRAWQAAGWARFDDLEINCTVQLFRFGDEAIRQVSRLRVLTIDLEWVQPSPEMLRGEVSAIGMRRPDMHVSVGSSASRLIECKRLSGSGRFPRDYVEAGIARFVTGQYVSGGKVGWMVAYLQDDNESRAIAAVNKIVSNHPAMGSSDQLGNRTVVSASIPRYLSIHARTNPALELRHYVIPLA